MKEGTAVLEAYDYLGLGTIVRRSQPQVGSGSLKGMELTYIKATGESDGDAGDQYSGLDRFGRIEDQRWRVGRTFMRGDMNGDGTVNNLDSGLFVLGLSTPTGPESFQDARPDLYDILVELGDINQDGFFNNLDLSPFVALLTGSGTPSYFDAVIELDRNRYEYDTASNRVAELNLKDSRSEAYKYDGLQRLTEFQRGYPSETAARAQEWELDSLGNSREVRHYTFNDTLSGGNNADIITETRGHTEANEISSWSMSSSQTTMPAPLALSTGPQPQPAPETPNPLDPVILNDSHVPTLREALQFMHPIYAEQNASFGEFSFADFLDLLNLTEQDLIDDETPAGDPNPVTPPGGGAGGGTPGGGGLGLLGLTPQSTSEFYDDAGNMIARPDNPDIAYVYDAWNRLVKAENTLEMGIYGTYQYDGRHHRIVATVGSTTTHDYFNDNWQVIEQRVGSSTDASAQFVWSIAYVNALVQEQRDTDSNGSLDRTLWTTHDANFNVTAAVNDDGIAEQRYLYDPYGLRSILNTNWQPPGGSPTALLQHGFQGGREDAETKLILLQRRYVDVYLQRFVTRDPLMDAYQDGPNLYQCVGSNPSNWVDPSGMTKKPSKPTTQPVGQGGPHGPLGPPAMPGQRGPGTGNEVAVVIKMDMGSALNNAIWQPWINVYAWDATNRGLRCEIYHDGVGKAKLGEILRDPNVVDLTIIAHGTDADFAALNINGGDVLIADEVAAVVNGSRKWKRIVIRACRQGCRSAAEEWVKAFNVLPSQLHAPDGNDHTHLPTPPDVATNALSQ